MSDAAESRDIKENFVEDQIKVDVEATTINLDCVKSEPNEGTLDYKEDNHSTQYKITLKYEDIYGESSRQIKIEEDYDNLIGFLDNDVIMENAMIKLEAIKEEDDVSFNNFYCQKCKGIYKGYCLMCTTLLCILNKNTSIASFEAESNTIPTDILEIRTTSTGKGVYLLRAVPINVIFGPFEGILGIESTIGHSWKIIDNKLRNINSGNWMKNIVCAASASFKNLDIVQIDGNLYFQTNREITEGEELLTYYDDEKLQQLDNTEECLYTPQKREKLPKIFACTVCCLGFGSNKCLMEHKGKCCQMEYSRSMDEFVLIECHYCKMWMEKWEHEEYHVAYCLEKHHRMWGEYSERVDRSDADVEEMGNGDCSARDDKRRYRGGDIYSRRKDRRDDWKFNTEDCQCLSGGNQEARLNECGALLERSNNEQTQNTIATNNSHHLHKNLNKHKKGGGGSIKPFKCDICMMTFTQKGHLKSHVKSKHTDDGGVKDYKCLECFYQTNNKSHFQKHLNTHKGIKRFQCDVCMMKFTQKSNFNRHVKNKHTEKESGKDYKCSHCSFQTNYKRSLQTHLNKHRDIKPFECYICMMKFTQKIHLKMHIKNKHRDDANGKDYKCSHCSYETNYKHCLKSHMKHKHADNVKDYQCLECSFQTKYKYYLKSHMKNKHADNAKDYQCLECSYETNYKHDLKSHMKNKHADNAKDYQCLECSYQTNSKRDIQRHLNTHKGIKRFQCDICMKTFTLKDSLKIHVKYKHTEKESGKNYKCSQCSFQTNYKRSLQTHLNKHRNIKPFKCYICMMKFTAKNYVKLHIKNKHTDDANVKDYKCSHCSYETNYKTNFQTHLNTHRGKPFTCDICKAKFALKDYLKGHIKNTHADDSTDKDYKCLKCSFQTNYKFSFQTHLNEHKGNKRFKCDICLKKFIHKGSLKHHIKNKHTNDANGKDYKCLCPVAPTLIRVMLANFD